MIRLRILFIICLLPCLLACGRKKDIRQGSKSLEGVWMVTSISTEIGQRTNGGTSVDTSYQEQGNLGTFHFEEEELDYQYTRGGIQYSGKTPWSLDRFKVNEGFVRVPKFELTTDETLYDCEFGDETKNAEKNADQVRLIDDSDEIGPYLRVRMELTKQ